MLRLATPPLGARQEAATPEGVVFSASSGNRKGEAGSQGRVFSAIKKIIRASPALRDRARITNTVITFPETGATITAIASDAAGAAGANPVISVGDELWGFTSEASRMG